MDEPDREPQHPAEHLPVVILPGALEQPVGSGRRKWMIGGGAVLAVGAIVGIVLAVMPGSGHGPRNSASGSGTGAAAQAGGDAVSPASISSGAAGRAPAGAVTSSSPSSSASTVPGSPSSAPGSAAAPGASSPAAPPPVGSSPTSPAAPPPVPSPPPPTTSPASRDCTYDDKPASQLPVTNPGSTDSAAVKQLQCLLKKSMLGISTLAVDGQFGPLTESAVRSFQQCSNKPTVTPPHPGPPYRSLAIDGSVGPQTWTDLYFWDDQYTSTTYYYCNGTRGA